MPRVPKKTDTTETTPTIRVKRTRRATDTPATASIIAATPGITDAEISKLAYQLYEARGGVNGSPLDDWLEAERQLVTR